MRTVNVLSFVICIFAAIAMAQGDLGDGILMLLIGCGFIVLTMTAWAMPKRKAVAEKATPDPITAMVEFKRTRRAEEAKAWQEEYDRIIVSSLPPEPSPTNYREYYDWRAEVKALADLEKQLLVKQQMEDFQNRLFDRKPLADWERYS